MKLIFLQNEDMLQNALVCPESRRPKEGKLSKRMM